MKVEEIYKIVLNIVRDCQKKKRGDHATTGAVLKLLFNDLSREDKIAMVKWIKDKKK